MIVVDGDQAKRIQDPAVPTQAEVALGMPVGDRGPSGPRAGAARADVARSSTRPDARAARARGASPARPAGADAGRSTPPAARARPRAKITTSSSCRWRRWYVLSLRALRKLSGARDAQLRYVVNSVERWRWPRRLTPTRMPASFLQLERNRQYWQAPLPRVRRPGELPWQPDPLQYYPGRGLQLQPLSTFKKANALHGFCERGEAECDEAALRRILDEMTALAVKRSRAS